MSVKLISVANVARICGVERTTVYRWVKSGMLEAINVKGGSAKIAQSELVRFMREKAMDLPPELSMDERPRVLIVDDDLQFIQSLVAEMQRVSNWAIEFATDGYDACIKAGRYLPDAMLLDLRMPGFSGTEVIKRIKSNPETEGIQIVVVTGYEEEITDELHRLEIEGVFLKPVSATEITARLIEVLKLQVHTA